jgi:4-amino-4-deoxy-L-arabinose transferase-like glycosyltransferase
MRIGAGGRNVAQELTRESTTLSDGARSLVSKDAPWHRIGLGAILCLSAFLNLFRITSQGYGNTYYAAAVKDMLTSWHNFFFVSFDAGFVTVDKPPLGLWIQAASAYLFGLGDGLSLLVPQALAGVLSVALLYHLVCKAFSPVAGIVAALVLAVSPIAVAVERTNNADGLLVLSVLVGTWAVVRAVETGRLRWVVVMALMVGLGFNIKMLEAYLVLPAFYMLYLLASRVSWRRRFMNLGLGTLVLLVVSLSWAVVVDLTPADQRPYVGSSSNNSELDLIAGYNGLGRLMGRAQGADLVDELINGNEQHDIGSAGGSQSAQQQASGAQGGFGSSGSGPGNGRENGQPGPLRLLNEQMAGQIGWLLPLAILGLLAASWQNRPRLPIDQQNQGLPLWRRWRSRLLFSFKNLPQLSLDRQQGALVLWGMWMLTMVIFFSIAGQFHRYYMVMLAPAVAALVGAGVVAFWRDYRRQGWRGWLLPLTLLGMAALQAYIILAYYDEDWSYWVTGVVVGLCLVAVVGLVVLRLRLRLKLSAYSASVVAVGMLALLVAPTIWAAYTMWQGGGGRMAAAGPQTVQGSSWGGPGGGPRGGSGGRDNADPVLMDYLQANRGAARYLVATANARSASPMILNTDEPDPVITFGGFGGRDPVLGTDQLANLIDKGAVRFFLIQDRQGTSEDQQEGTSQSSPPWGERPQNESASWVQDNCEQVPKELWQSPEAEEQGGGGPQMRRAQALYDCGAGSSRVGTA